MGGVSPDDERNFLINSYKDHFETGVAKNSVEDLTSDEVAAMKLFMGVPYHYDRIAGTIEFVDSGIIKQGSKWIIGVAPNQ